MTYAFPWIPQVLWRPFHHFLLSHCTWGTGAFRGLESGNRWKNVPWQSHQGTMQSRTEYPRDAYAYKANTSCSFTLQNREDAASAASTLFLGCLSYFLKVELTVRDGKRGVLPQHKMDDRSLAARQLIICLPGWAE